MKYKTDKFLRSTKDKIINMLSNIFAFITHPVYIKYCEYQSNKRYDYKKIYKILKYLKNVENIQ